MSQRLDAEAENTFRRLLGEFRDARATYENEVLKLEAYTQEEWEARNKQVLAAGRYFLGFAYPTKSRGEFDTPADMHVIVASTFRSRSGQVTQEPPRSVCVFQSLALRAGATLTKAICEELSIEEAHAPTSWFSLMWRLNPPSSDELSRQLFSDAPFMESAHAIERLLGDAATDGGRRVAGRRDGDRTTETVSAESCDGYVSADTIAIEHGIPKQRLSEGKKAGFVKWKPAPAGTKDSQGRAVRILYHVQDALKYASPKHVKDKTRRKPLGRGKSDL